jgi:hypothetical protein
MHHTHEDAHVRTCLSDNHNNRNTSGGDCWTPRSRAYRRHRIESELELHNVFIQQAKSTGRSAIWEYVDNVAGAIIVVPGRGQYAEWSYARALSRSRLKCSPLVASPLTLVAAGVLPSTSGTDIITPF